VAQDPASPKECPQQFFILLLGVIAIPYLLNAMYIWIAVARPGTRQEMTAPRLAPKNSKEN
jgi:hypothetical protein